MLSGSRQFSQFQRMLDLHELAMTVQIVRAKNKFINAAAAHYKYHAGDVFHDEYMQLIGEIKNIFTMHYKQIIPKFGRQAMAGIKGYAEKIHTKDDGDTEQSLFEQLSSDWVEENALRNATSVSDTTREDVRGAIQNGLDGGFGTAQIAGDIAAVTLLSRYRAEVISRTETHNAATYANIESVRDASGKLGINLVKFWIPVLDERTRESHADMAGQPGIPIDQPFIVGGYEMDRPGDPAGGAGNVINCRCAMKYEAADGEDS